MNGGTPRADERFWGGDVRWATPVDLARVDGGLLRETDRNLTEDGLDAGSSLAPAGAVVLSTRAPIGYTALLSHATAFNQGCKAVVSGHHIEPRFLQFHLIAARRALQARGQGSTFLELSNDSLLSYPIDVPTLDRQQRIADFLDDQVAGIDSIIAARMTQAERLSALWGAALDREFLEESIKPVRLGRLAEVQSGLTINDREQRGLEAGTPLPYLSVANVKDGYLDLTVVKVATVSPGQVFRHSLQRGDVLMTEGGDLDKLGRGTVWSGEIDPCLHQNHVFAVRPHDGDLDPWYLTLFSQSRPARVHFMLTASKSTNLASTSASKVQALAVPLRAISEQRAIAASLKRQREELDRAGCYLDRSSELLAEYKQSLITAAVTGELDVTTASGRSLPV